MNKFILLLLTSLFLNLYVAVAQPSSPLLENPPKETDVVVFPIALNWSNVSGADCYYVQVVTDTTLAFAEPVCMTSTSNLDLTASDADPDTKYYWRVYAHNSEGWGEPSAYSCFTTADLTAEGSIENLTDGVIDLIAEDHISQTQGTYLIRLLEQAEARVLAEQEMPAIITMYFFKARIFLLRISGLITQPVYDNLNYSSDGVIDLIADMDTPPTVMNNLSSPEKYSLVQNYPNPFNPVTTIEYSIPQSSFVSIKVYDMLGREVADLVSKHHETGTYLVEWNASNISSGIYFYTIRSGNFVDTKKMVMTK
jgi:hypothetical protein